LFAKRRIGEGKRGSIELFVMFHHQDDSVF